MSPRPGRQILTAITRIRAALVYRAVIFSGRLYALRARQRRRADVTENPRELFDPLGARRTSDPNLLIPLGPVVENLTANRDPRRPRSSSGSVAPGLGRGSRLGLRLGSRERHSLRLNYVRRLAGTLRHKAHAAHRAPHRVVRRSSL